MKDLILKVGYQYFGACVVGHQMLSCPYKKAHLHASDVEGHVMDLSLIHKWCVLGEIKRCDSQGRITIFEMLSSLCNP